MNAEDLGSLALDMIKQGMASLWNGTFYAYSDGPDCHNWGELAVIQAAHAAELLMKARIVQENFAHIFTKNPDLKKLSSKTELFEKFKTIGWSELPGHLKKYANITIPHVNKYRDFGKLRNVIYHLSIHPYIEPRMATLKFIFEVVDPFINDNWGLFAIDCGADYEPYSYLPKILVESGILFRVSRESAIAYNEWDIDWSKVKKRHREEMLTRISHAMNTV